MSLFSPSNALLHCEQEVRKNDELAVLHSLFIPKDVRPYFFVIQHLRIQMFKTREQTQNSTLKTSRLQWWLQNLDNIWDNKPTQEPLSLALHELYKFTGVHKSHLVRMVRGRVT
jgi:phytoene/squalene synthetase